MHHLVAQVTAHDTINAGHPGLMNRDGTDKKCTETLQKLHKEADQAWEDTNNVVYDHQLQYDTQLKGFIASTKRTLQEKWDEIWEWVQ